MTNFEIKIYEGAFANDSEEDETFDFNAKLSRYYGETDCGRKDLASASGFITEGDSQGIMMTADISGDTFVEGYTNFLDWLEEQEANECFDPYYKVMIIERIDANEVGKGFGTELLNKIKHFAKTIGVVHIVLIADSKSEVDLEKYYRKVGFMKLRHENWLYVLSESNRELIEEMKLSYGE